MDPNNTLWLAYQDPALEDESRRMAGRTNFFGTVVDELADYLANWGYDGKSISVFTPARAASVADVIAKVWPGAVAVAGTSDDQALKEPDPTGIGRRGEPRKGWGQK